MTRIDEIQELLTKRKTYREIGLQFGISHQRIHQLVKKNNLRRQPQLRDLPKVKSMKSLLYQSGKPWCSRCKRQDIPLLKCTKKSKEAHYFLCRPCQSFRCRAYYATPKGKEAVLRAKMNYKLKNMSRTKTLDSKSNM